jgi:hypothetical protein
MSFILSHFGKYLSLSKKNDDGSVIVTTWHLDTSGQPAFSLATLRTENEAINEILTCRMKDFQDAFRTFISLVQRETYEFWKLKFDKDLQRKIGIYDPKIVDVATAAWFSDGGFIEAFNSLGFGLDAEKAMFTVLDAEFDPSRDFAGLGVWPAPKSYDLSKKSEIDDLIVQIGQAKSAVDTAAEALRMFMIAHLTVEDIL